MTHPCKVYALPGGSQRLQRHGLIAGCAQEHNRRVKMHRQRDQRRGHQQRVYPEATPPIAGCGHGHAEPLGHWTHPQSATDPQRECLAESRPPRPAVVPARNRVTARASVGSSSNGHAGSTTARSRARVPSASTHPIRPAAARTLGRPARPPRPAAPVPHRPRLPTRSEIPLKMSSRGTTWSGICGVSHAVSFGAEHVARAARPAVVEVVFDGLVLVEDVRRARTCGSVRLAAKAATSGWHCTMRSSPAGGAIRLGSSSSAYSAANALVVRLPPASFGMARTPLGHPVARRAPPVRNRRRRSFSVVGPGSA
jgi:hypothetical protein